MIPIGSWSTVDGLPWTIFLWSPPFMHHSLIFSECLCYQRECIVRAEVPIGIHAFPLYRITCNEVVAYFFTGDSVRFTRMDLERLADDVRASLLSAIVVGGWGSLTRCRQWSLHVLAQLGSRGLPVSHWHSANCSHLLY